MVLGGRFTRMQVMLMLKKPEVIQQVYNDGTVVFNERKQAYDKYGTPIRNKYSLEEVSRAWFRYLGITSQDTYHAHADGKELTEKIAIKGKTVIDVKWTLQINSNTYEVYRSYYNSKNNETELSLVGVKNDN
ncbi:hypothetical protein FEZ33_01210 [Ruoffia tabacinasalis]|uniref:Uncharacterized protein n=2 Tax=Ruoffia tabacinasalis TaxID=87458 RepID=A0A5R9EGL1_9LACT|nr:hypothetical protein FEZ33_01210 [Ruoffia tabacinasalis]